MTIKRFLRKSSAVSILVMLAVFAQYSVVSAVEPIPIPIPITANINLDPNTINLESNGKWITVYIELPAPYDVRKIDKSSVTLNVNGYDVPAELKPSNIGDYDRDGKPDLMLKFDRQTVQSHLFAGPTELTVSGTVNGAAFRGSDTINAMAKGINATILQTSDVHDHASGAGPFLDYTPDGCGNDVVRGGFARLATVIETVRAHQAAQKIPTILVDSGDWYMGTTYDMTVADPVALRFFQLMDYDAITLGNHEFDWSPDGLAKILGSGLTNGFNVPVVATNTMTDSIIGNGDDNIALLMDNGVIVNKKIIDLPNGLKIGLLGLVGPDADKDAPVAPPITFNHSYPFIQDQVKSLRNKDNVDLVVVLSHGGIELDGTGDDADLAKHVTGIDIIASGHYHTATHVPIVKRSSKTIIFSPGEYGEYVSRLDFTYSKKLGRIIAFDFTLLPVDDTIVGDVTIQGMVDSYNKQLDATLKSAFALSSGQSEIISKTSFDLKMNPVAQNRITGLGSLCADSLRAVANQVLAKDEKPYDLAIVGSGVIRDPLLEGNTGNISFADVYNCLPLGISPDTTQPAPGYPLMSIYATGLELYIISEVGLTMSAQPGYGSFYLNFSGSKIDYSLTGASSLKGVQSVSLYAPGDFSCTGPATSIAPDGTLYHVVVDLYALQLLNIVNGMINPYGLSIIPKNKNGIAINFTNPTDPLHYMNFRIDISPESGVQELKEWMALWQFLTAFPGIPVDVYDHTNPDALVNGRVVVGP